jgi:hypothetical protein
MKTLKNVALLIPAATLALAGHSQAGRLTPPGYGYPLGWVYGPAIGININGCAVGHVGRPGCQGGSCQAARCFIDDPTEVEVHTRPDKKSNVVAVFRSEGNEYIVRILDEVSKWLFLVLACPVAQNKDGSIRCDNAL